MYIYKCENSTVQVKGKVNSITIDSCKKIGRMFFFFSYFFLSDLLCLCLSVLHVHARSI